MNNPIIDSHQHFWRLSCNDYAWLTPALKSIYRDFMPEDLLPLLKELHISGTILVQAAPTMDETFFLLDLAQHYSFIFGVVGWVDLIASNATKHIKLLTKHNKFCGIRPMLQDIDDVNWILQKKIKNNLKILEELNLTFDALILPKHLLIIEEFATLHPHLKIVIDHAAKPSIKTNQFEPWANDIKKVATHENVYCKLSGLLTEALTNTSWEDIKPYVDHLFACFGSKRMLWGSDYPVLNLASDYRTWFFMCQKYVMQMNAEAFGDVFGKNAIRFYRINL